MPRRGRIFISCHSAGTPLPARALCEALPTRKVYVAARARGPRRASFKGGAGIKGVQSWWARSV
eukprot:2269730-Prymnesium_polylepis.1